MDNNVLFRNTHILINLRTCTHIHHYCRTHLLTTHVHHYYPHTCSRYKYIITTHTHAHNTHTSLLPTHMLTTHIHHYYPHTCSQHTYIITTHTHAHNTHTSLLPHTCSQHTYIITTHTHAHNTHTSLLPTHMLTTHIHHYCHTHMLTTHIHHYYHTHMLTTHIHHYCRTHMLTTHRIMKLDNDLGNIVSTNYSCCQVVYSVQSSGSYPNFVHMLVTVCLSNIIQNTVYRFEMYPLQQTFNFLLRLNFDSHWKCALPIFHNSLFIYLFICLFIYLFIVV